MDLDQLRTFVAIAREGNLTRASQRIHLSQPAVSGQLKALEEELGLVLFTRSARGMDLTAAGRSILVEAERALTAAGGIAARARSLKGDPAEVFRLGTISEPTILRLGQILTALNTTHPHLTLKITQGISGDVIKAVVDGKLDGGYVIGAIDDPRLHAMTVAPIMLRVVAPPRLSDRLDTTSLASLADLPWISTPRNCSFHHITNAMFAREGLTPRIVMEADDEHTLGELVASGIGLTLLREDVALRAEARGEVVMWRHLAETSTLTFIHLQARAQAPSIEALVNIMRRTWNLDDLPNGPDARPAAAPFSGGPAPRRTLPAMDA